MPFLPPTHTQHSRHIVLLLLLHLFNGLFPRQSVQASTRKVTPVWIQISGDDGVFWDGSGIGWTICKQSAPRSRHTTTPTPHHSMFTGRMLSLTPNQQCQGTECVIAFKQYDYKPVDCTGVWQTTVRRHLKTHYCQQAFQST